MRGIRILQGFVLLCILLIPVLIIVFLKTMTTNSYDIPIYYETGVDNPLMECDFVENEQHRIPSFEFTNQYNEQMGSKEMKGKITVVDFFFTSCPSICPVMSTEMERVNDMFRDEDDVQIYSISIDPEHDTPEVLMKYADLHQATKGKWHFLTGDKDITYDLARCGFILPAMDGGDVPDDFVHSDKFVLIDGEGRIRGYYSGTNSKNVDDLMVEIKILLYGKK
ncbi:SCO family protein [Belliella sp. DSM 107340]|uniref:SCO family protein n=1 Tax=Belliella calami TaxID=2923436 RepID=A0ABS9USY2_9BACT|nr:SCO family protein [Belliella calami]MCH7399736.1 SCO family protein [Belliella calami]